MRITVEGVGYDVEVEMLDDGMKGTVASTRRATVSASGSERGGAMEASPGFVPPPVSAAASAAGAGQVSAGGDGKQVKSPIAGTVQSVSVRVGDAVKVNDTLLVLEAMKMESAVASPIAGTVKSVGAEAGKAVRMGDVLVEFE